MDPESDHVVDVNDLPGVITALADMHPHAIISEQGLASIFSRHVVSVKRAVARGELPPPCDLFGTKVWIADILIRHIKQRLEQAAKDAEQTARRIASHGRS